MKKKLMKNLPLLFLLFTYTLSFSQKENNVWYFGNESGIDFNTAPPTVLTDGKMNAYEGCASVCDDTGKLLFYTNGSYVWNRNHLLMPNGKQLDGGSSSSQAVIIVKKPGSSFIYYIFTTAQRGTEDGLRYSIVNMQLENGLGDVTDKKNIPIVTPTCEKVTAVQHKNGKDFWIITHLYDSNAFHSYLFTNNGISMTPVVSNVGKFLYSNILKSNAAGYLKVSPSRKKIAIANYTAGVEILDFDNSSGILSNAIFLEFNEPVNAYGVEFSPNGSVLYVSRISVNQSLNLLHQYNLLGSATNIINSMVEIDAISTDEGAYGALQTGPDLRIYLTKGGGRELAVIKQPNKLGLNCEYDPEGVFLEGKISSFGLPMVSDIPYIPVSFTAQYFCLGNTTIFTPTPIEMIDSIHWNFGDPTSTTNTSDSIIGQHVFSDTGYFDVTLTTVVDDNLYTTTQTIHIRSTPPFTLGDDRNICEGEKIHFDLKHLHSKYLWQDGSKGPRYTIEEEGIYWLTIHSNNCVQTDSVLIEIEDCFEIPNIFSPNNDSYNDFFKIKGIQYKTWNLQIYNRWGRLIHESLDYKNDWDGDTVSDGSYYYILSSQEKGEITSYKGWVEIVR